MVIQKLLLEEGVKRGLKASREYSVSVLGYDFIGLISRLAIFFITGFLINAYFQASIQGGIWLNSLAGFFGVSFPTTLPEWTVKLFTTGVYNITFWQIVQTIAVLIVVVEYMQYDRMLKENNNHPNTTTTAVFAMIGLGLSLITFPQIVQKFKEMRILSKAPRTDVTKGFGGESL
jgi:tellurite resistance protein TehA-like permease